MKKIITKTLIILFTINSFGQKLEEIDSISIEFCKYLKTTSNIQNDSIRINRFYQEKFDVYLNRFEREKANKLGSQLFYRTQKNCREFTELLERLYPPKESVTRKKEKPNTNLSGNEILDFWNRDLFKYFENNGNETIVVIKNNKYKETFTDSTYSKLEYKKISNYEFELEFIESNNEIRSSYSLKGDKFIYGIIDKTENYYLISTKVENQDYYELFKLYFD